ncbi:2-dehydro-3-deoxy-6-phosphogalactonate aldolase [Verminephrobacter aporrectodeae subsp. tuberculatae]|uniref:2-dehydro-3-deoxy-6-phosphogalactonate aldolase n=1 Tax=Verminephrobacter aporrectodeae TaxID=1110389 RepID=UPI002AA2A487|nr:2-dehydro-3-deoxy-6-phosphogalactonate aldolase [Verminephrobacter aporrectodeae]MCW5257748.1 2-dehydro-3-deoxy-6-phosphogalactonate aldolase [Verminephrobacter aporrectodeae subsp. tuberculatae]MCW8206955.1 2-dehydro-3-deoxy-6-phosphogalactonate aldolase [Verminephrobacter aporrectodeae subsp. tuberculatae]
MSMQALFKLPLIAILRGVRPHEVLAHAGALVEAGFDAIEVPLNSPDGVGSIAQLIRALGSGVTIGAGTVLQVEQVEALERVGARMLVTPNTQPRVIARARAAGMLTCIGCMTATEAFAALDAGADALKIFPASALGPAYIRALRAVLPPDVPVFAVGGISADNLAEYLAAGCAGAGLGGELYRAGQTVQRTRSQAQAFVQAFQAFQTSRETPP